MSKIKKLPLIEAKKIAAGEVVERPANIVKELIENSIDANSTLISVYVKDGGKKQIRVADNGEGMSEDDAKLCFDHHATSKILSVNDLDKIYTYGFRGEALSSIASVSKVALITKNQASKLGIKLILEDGEIQDESLVSVNSGTEIIVDDIFYNVPARKKFLKRSETEWRNISQLFQSYCFVYKNIHFKLFNDDNLVFNCPPVKSIKDRILQVWNTKLSQNMLPVLFKSDFKDINNFEIEGCISNHQVSQFNKSRIYLFVNNRWIKNFELTKAFLKGYRNVLPVGKLPVGVISIKVSPEDVDINVHPRKEEVKLLHSFKVENSLFSCVKKALEDNLSRHLNQDVYVSGAKTLSFEKSLQLYVDEGEPKNQDQTYVAARPSDFLEENQTKERSTLNSLLDYSFNFSHPGKLQDFEMEELFGSPTRNFVRSENSDFVKDGKEKEVAKYIGQIKRTYLLIENEEGLLVVDQHAAHECVLFDLFTKKFDYVSTVKLVFPHLVTLSKNDVDSLVEHLPLLKKYGIEVERMGIDQIVINATPVYLKDISLDDLILQVVSWIHEYEKVEKGDFEERLSKDICAQMACKAAIKAGDTIEREQVEQLMKDLYSIENRFTCPHGRPTFWSLSTNDIEKKFKRDYKS